MRGDEMTVIRKRTNPKCAGRPNKTWAARCADKAERAELKSLRKRKRRKAKDKAGGKRRRRGKQQRLSRSEYAKYIVSPEWMRRAAALKLKRGACEDCGESEGLQVHHLTYQRLGYERDSDLLVLCDDCHAARHGRGGGS